MVVLRSRAVLAVDIHAILVHLLDIHSVPRGLRSVAVHNSVPPASGCPHKESKQAAAAAGRVGMENFAGDPVMSEKCGGVAWPLASLSGFHVEGRRVNILCQVA